MKRRTIWTRDRLIGERGFTIVEMMVAVGVTAVIVAAAMTTVVNTNRANIANSQIADTQQNVRLATELIGRDIKMAGFNYNPTDPATSSIAGCTTTVGAISKPVGIRPQDQNSAGADTGPDSISMVVPVQNTTAWTLTAAVGGTQNAPAPYNSISLSAAAITQMVSQGLGVGSTISIGGAVSKTVASVAATSIGFGAGNFVDARFPAGTAVYLMQCVQYQVIANNVATCGSTRPCLVRNGTPIVDGVEDLQITYACDGCNTTAPNPALPDGVVDNQDGSTASGQPSFTQGDFVSNSTWGITPWTPDKIKLAQVSIVAIQPKAEQGTNEKGTIAANSSTPAVVGDHDPATSPGYSAPAYQQQRRRVLVRTIQPRNL